MKINILITATSHLLYSTVLYGQNISSEFFKSFSISERYDEHQFQINGFLAITAGYFIIQKKQNFKLRSRYKKIITNLSAEIQNKSQIQTSNNQTNKKYNSTDFSKKITSSMEKRIVDGLINFKKSEKFLARESSLEIMTKEIDVAYEYLNQVIQKHTSMNADLYFHHLRINYLLRKLYEDPKFRDYKAADLASICGYHSAGEFEFYFKKICRISSEYFVKQLKRDTLKQKRSVKVAA